MMAMTVQEILTQAKKIIEGSSDTQKDSLEAEKELQEKLEEMKRVKNETKEIISAL